MSKKTKYKQCQLQNGNRHMVSWIPEQFAHVGKILELLENDEWEDGWQVMTAGGDAIEEPPTVDQMIRGHRKRTGDSLPKEAAK